MSVSSAWLSLQAAVAAAWLLARLARHLPLAPAAALRLTRFCWLAALAAPLVQVALPAPALPASPQVWTGPAASAEARLQLRALPALVQRVGLTVDPIELTI